MENKKNITFEELKELAQDFLNADLSKKHYIHTHRDVLIFLEKADSVGMDSMYERISNALDHLHHIEGVLV